MTKFLTWVFRILPLVFSAFSAHASPSACPLLFTELSPSLFSPGAQTSLISDQKILRSDSSASVRLHVSGTPDARVKRAIDELRVGLKLHFEHAVSIEGGKPVEQDAFLPLPLESVIQVPAQALVSNDALATFLESLLPVTRQYVYQRDRESNLNVTAQFTAQAKALLDAVFEKFGTRSYVRDIEEMGRSEGNALTIDKSFAKRTRAIGTVAHEIYHTTVTRKLTANATLIDVGRGIWFQLANPKVPKAYQGEFRADELEARLRQIGSFKRHKFKDDVASVEKTAAAFLIEQLEVSELILGFWDEARIGIQPTPRYSTPRSIKVSLGRDILYLPLVKDVVDLRAYTKSVLEKRVEILRAK